MTERAATIGELESGLNGLGASAEFLASQLREGASVSQATARFAGILFAENNDLKAKLSGSEAKTYADKAKAKSAYKMMDDFPPAHEKGEGHGKSRFIPEDGPATAEWNSALSELVATGMSREKAVIRLTNKFPELHNAFVNEANGR